MTQIMAQGLSKTGRICQNLTEPESRPNARTLRSNTPKSAENRQKYKL